MRNISFALTTDQIRNRTKTVTRRLGWQNLKRGTLLCAVVKGMGLKPGEKVERLCVICVTDVRREPLQNICFEDGGPRKEGFPRMRNETFVGMFMKHMRCRETDEVTRIEFRYIPGGRL